MKNNHPDCSKDFPDFSNTECDPGPGKDYSKMFLDVTMAMKREADKKLLNGNPIVFIDDDANAKEKPGMNRKQRRNKSKTFRPGMMRGNNFTPAKKKRK